MSVTGKIAVVGNLTESVANDLATAAQAIGPELASWVLTSGVAADQADKIWHDTRTLTASATEDLDLNAGLTGGAFGTVVFAKLKAIIVVAAAANTNDVQLTRSAANGVPFLMAAGDGISIGPGDAVCLTRRGLAGWTVTAATADLITLTNSAGSTSVTYTIVLIGTSA